MTAFSYQAVTAEGESRDGQIEASDKAMAVEQLQKQGLIPMSVEPVTSAGLRSRITLTLPWRGRGQHQRMLTFTEDLSALLQAGIVLDRALVIMASVARDEALAELIGQVQESVRKGRSLSVALGDLPEVFSSFYINMVQASEAAGDIGAGLNDLAIYLERSRALREKTLSALIYPAILLFVSALSLLVILTWVVPQFEQLFEDMGQALPLATQVVISSANFLLDYGIIMLLLLVALGFGLSRLLQQPGFRLNWDRRSLGWPLWGALHQRIEVARFSRSLGTLVSAGVPLLQGLTIARNTLANQALIEQIDVATERVKSGSTLAEPLLASGLFPPLMLQMVQVGEETGQLNQMLLKIADLYDRQVATAIQRTLTILEPLLIVGLGILIAGIILSILVAIMSINQLPV